MKIIVWGTDEQVAALKKGNENINWIRLANPTAWVDYPDAAAFFDLAGNINDYGKDYPVFVNKVHAILPVQQNLVRMNGWPGFLENDTWEIAGQVNEAAISILKTLNKNFIICADEPGFISARIIAMIINEAYMAKEEGVSTASEIDVAMKLGTNYPYGPFEWAEKIGLPAVHSLLVNLSKTNVRYNPAVSMTALINQF